MENIRVPKIWKYIFNIGYYLAILHFIKFLYSYIFGYIPWYKFYVDYSYYSINSLLIRFFCALLIFLLNKYKSNFPIAASTIVWFILWVLLSHEHDIYTFLIIPIIFIYSLINFLALKNKRN